MCIRDSTKHEVVLMIYNKKDCKARARAGALGIPSAYSNDENWIINELKWAGVDIIVLAGWMKILSKHFVDSFPRKIINLHPSLLPKYKGLHAIEQALNNGDEKTGCTVHYVTEELDSGEIILQGEVPIKPDDTVESLTRAVHMKEWALLPAAVDML